MTAYTAAYMAPTEPYEAPLEPTGASLPKAPPRLALGPLQYLWPRELALAFYAAASTWPVDIVYLGETVCSKRRELRTRDWLRLAGEIADAGKQVVLSSLALIEAESELHALMRLIEQSEGLVEANDISAVQLCREHSVPFVGGPTLNVYNHDTLAMLVEDGLTRWVPGVEHSHALIGSICSAHRDAGGSMPELELIGWGRLPLAYSARCFTARAANVAKDQCAFRCVDHPDGIPLATRDGAPLLRINGIQIQTDAPIDMGPEWCAMQALGAHVLRIYPQQHGTAEVVAYFDRLRRGLPAVAPAGGVRNGYWHGQPGMVI